MKLKFYVSFIFLFFVCAVAEGQYRIWKPVTTKSLPSAQAAFTFCIPQATCDSNNLYLLAKYYPYSKAILAKYDGMNYSIDSVDLSSVNQNNPSVNYGLLTYKDKLYTYDNNLYTGTGDSSKYPIHRLDSNKRFTPFVNLLWRRAVNGGQKISDAIVYKDKMYVMGGIRGLDSIKCNGIAMYDGVNWNTLDNGTNEGLPDRVYGDFGSFKIFNNKLYILAHSSDSVISNNFILCWDGDKWLFKKEIKDDSVRWLTSLSVLNNKLYAVSNDWELILYEIDDSVFSTTPTAVFEGQSFGEPTNLDNSIWSISSDAISIIDTEKVYLAPQYLIPEYNTPIQYTKFKDKIYAYGDFELINGNGDTLRYLAQTDAKLNKISGQVYYDNDSNCMYGKGDLNIRGLVKLMPESLYTNTDKSGRYNLVVNGDSVTVEPVVRNYFKINSCSPQKYIIHYNDTLPHSHLDFSLGKNILVNDLSINLDGSTGWRARRGFTETYTINIKNEGTLEDSGLLKLYLPNKTNIVSSIPAATSTGNGWAAWKIPTIYLFDESNISISVYIDTSNHNDDSIIFYTEIINNNDHNLTDNYDTLSQIIVSSHDPNIIQVFPQGKDSINIVFPTHKQLEYLIHFENTGSDTAYNISVTDTLDGNLDASAFEIISSSHAIDYKILPYDQPSGSHILKFNFNNILLAPTDTTLTNQTDNAGFVSYKINLKKGLPIGTEITNRAYIYFDYNSAVETNTAIVRIDTTIANGISNPIYNNNNEGLYYWPVPSSDKLFVMNLLNQKQQLEVYNIEGKKLMTHSLNANETSSISLENLPNGMYFLRSLSNSGKVYKFIKN